MHTGDDAEREQDHHRSSYLRRDGPDSRGAAIASAAAPASAPAATATANANAHRHSTFSLRSPTLQHQSDFRPPPFSSPNALPHHHHNTNGSSANANGSRPNQSSPPPPPRPALPTPYMSSTTASGAPAGGPVAPSLPPPGSMSSSTSSGHHQHHGQGPPPPVSPLHPPSGYYPPSSTDRHHGIDSTKPATRSFYDPTTDTTKERRVSGSDAGSSWNHAPPAGAPKVRGNPLLLTRPASLDFSCLLPLCLT